MDKKKEMVAKIKELRKLWVEITELCYEIDKEDQNYALGEFADNYPFLHSFDEYIWDIDVWIATLENGI